MLSVVEASPPYMKKEKRSFDKLRMTQHYDSEIYF